MGLDGRPARSSKQRAMQRVSLQQRDDDQGLDLDSDPAATASARRTRKKAIVSLSSSDEDHVAQSSDDNDDNEPLGSGIFLPHQSDMSPKSKALAEAESAIPISAKSPALAISHPLDPHGKRHNDDESEGIGDQTSEDNEKDDCDFRLDRPKPSRRSLPLRLRVDGVVTKSGRISKPPKPISPELLPLRRPREKRIEVLPSREERYRRRSERIFRTEDSFSPSRFRGGELSRRAQKRQRSKSLNSLDENGTDEFEEDEYFEKDQRGSASMRRRNGNGRTRSRVIKEEDFERGPSVRTRAQTRPAVTAPDQNQVPYSLRLRSQAAPNGIGKSGSVKRNRLTLGPNYNDETMDGDGDFQTPDESEEAEDIMHDVEEDVLAQGSREDVSDDDFMNHRNSRKSSRRNRKARPQRSIASKRKRPRTRAGRDENSLARETKRSYRTRNRSLRREDFYHESEASSESSESSHAPAPRPQRSRPIRSAALPSSEAAAKNISEVDFLKNPMAVLDSPSLSRAKHANRYSRRRSKLQPSGPDPTASDGDDGPGGNVPTIEPIQVDVNLSWNDIGGLEHHVLALKEMVFLPLMYPEIFEKFHMEAPKGVLFYGPPGTGKTLCARALAASCGNVATEAGDETDAEGGVQRSDPVRTETEKPAPMISHRDEKMTDLTDGSKDVQIQDYTSNSAGHTTVPPAQLQPSQDPQGIRKEPSTVPVETTEKGTHIVGDPAATIEKEKVSSMTSPMSLAKTMKKKPRVSFFMRNGADCLSKWVGEAERQLRMTFEAAKKHEPAIIFFDEIDGLAPVRSSRQDQIHSSIVSTLLGLMDGLDSRGKIVVIGATNRVDAIDPALRRPGRFDRELIFTLPNVAARRKILGIHTLKWKPPPKAAVLDAVAKTTVGYCGADLKALCSEAAIRALRRRYPQIYESQDKLLIDVDQVRVSTKDFLAAMKDIVPASHRSARTHARPIPERLIAVLNHPLQSCILMLKRIFPQGLGPDAMRRSGLTQTDHMDGVSNSKEDHDDVFTSSDEDESDLDIQTMQDQVANAGKTRKVGWRSMSGQQHVLRPRLLICGQQGLGQAQLGPALLHFCEACPVHAIDYPSLHADAGARSAEEALISAFREAARSVPSVLYLPHLQLWWESAPQSLRTTLIVALKDLPSDLPILVLATAESPINGLPPEVAELFGDVHELSAPSEEHRNQLFSPLIEAAQAEPKMTASEAQSRMHMRVREVLPKAPPPVAVPLTREEKSKKVHAEDKFIRALRMEMRAFVESLLRDKRFKAFWNPVDPNSAPDYYEIIKSPMDISQIAARVDSGRYPTVLAMVNDFDVMMKNAIQYNPPTTETGAAILRRAHGLIDIVHAWVDNLSPSLVETCNKIIANRIARAEQEASAKVAQERNAAEAADPYANANGNEQERESGDYSATKDESHVDTGAAQCRPDTAYDKIETPVAVDTALKEQSLAESKSVPAESAVQSDIVGREMLIPAQPDQVAILQKLFLDVSTGMTVDGLEGLYVRCEKVLHERRRTLDRAAVVKALISTVRLARDDPALVGNLVE